MEDLLLLGALSLEQLFDEFDVVLNPSQNTIGMMLSLLSLRL